MNIDIRILIVNRDPVGSGTLANTLSAHGFACEVAHDAEQAITVLDRTNAQVDAAIGIAILDQDSAGPGGGMELVRQLTDHRPSLVPIVISGFRKVESAVQAMRLGAADYLLKPLVETELLDAVKRAEQRHLLLVDDEPAVAEPMPADDPSETFGVAIADEEDADGDWSPMPLAQAMKGPERRILLAALEANGWNRGQTAKQLDINRTTLYKKIRQYRLDEPA